MVNFLAKRYNQGDSYTNELFNKLITNESLAITQKIIDVPENANQLYLKINDKYFDPIDICVGIEVIELRNEIAKMKNVVLT